MINSEKKERAANESAPTIPHPSLHKLIQSQAIVHIACIALDNPGAVFEHGRDSYSLEVALGLAESLLDEAIESFAEATART